MPVAKKRVGGVWVNSTKAGFYRSGGSWVAFGPSGGTSETITWPSEPTSIDLVDGTQSYNMGIGFTLSANKSGLGVRWRVPTTVSTPGGSEGHVVGIWNATTTTLLVSKAFTPATGGYQNVLFDTPISLTSGTSYVATVYTQHYVFRSSTASVSSPSGVLTVSGGRLIPYNGGATTFPSTTSNSWFYVAPIISV
jgi:hypothetical protein